MKNKKIFIILSVTLIIIGVTLFIIVRNYDVQNSLNEPISDYTPEEEISKTQLRQTSISLYYIDEAGNLKEERKLIDSKNLINNPYKELITLLIAGPTNSNLTNAFPQGTQILDASLQKNQVTLDFSSEILDFAEEKQKLNLINSIINTLGQLNEVKSIKIIVNNEESDIFDEEYTISKN